ncbi:tumor protein p63-regulated gene 1-like protein isoform X1 [Lycorma delicatula]|uniref:tumor protein p63-regulated gene 1-like protein isoform X1 n=1 Tax=Lycorma delicatula TaxID=130591 RepID=UPI003F517F0B
MMSNEELGEGPTIDFKGTTLQINDSDSDMKLNRSEDNVLFSSSALNKNDTSVLNNDSRDVGCSSDSSTAIVPWWGEGVEEYFSNRAGLIELAVEECRKSVVSDEDGDYIGAWLLTEISSWDNEKERLIVLTTSTVITIKYDFIALKLLDHCKVLLSDIDTVIVGGLVYPNNSLIPRLNGLVSGVSGVVRGCVLQPLYEGLLSTNPSSQQQLSNKHPLEYANFEPRSRNINGVRTMWNNGKELPFIKKWNPFSKIPWTTYTSHPLLWCKGSMDEKRQKMYNVDEFTQNLVQAVERINERSTPCNIEHRPIILENYINLPSLIHNKNALGFFKVRGKFSF